MAIARAISDMVLHYKQQLSSSSSSSVPSATSNTHQHQHQHLNAMTWYDRLLLLSPKTWWGVMHQLQDSPFTEFNVASLIQALLAVMIPFYLCTYFQSLLPIPPTLTLASPWSVATIQEGIVPPMKQLVATARYWHRGRKEALPSALSCFQERLERGDCLDCGRYNVFLPTDDNDNDDSTTIQHVLLFIPGALIPHTAYAEVAAKLADLGICVVLVSMEPCRMATLKLGADVRRMQHIQSHVQRLLMEREGDGTTAKQHEQRRTVSWSVGGHSLGSFAAMALASHGIFDGLVMWGSANFINTRTNLSSQVHLPVLVLQGSNDALCHMDDASFAEFYKDFPQRGTTVCLNIWGAAHSWFASIDPGDPQFLGTSSITMEQQQEAAAQKTAKFLKNHVLMGSGNSGRN